MNERPKYDFARARRALTLLLKDPDDTKQVFEIIAALSGSTGERMLRRLKKTESGKRLLAARPSLLALLSDQKKLEAMPAGSLGRAYLEFIRTESISADGLVSASEVDDPVEPGSEQEWLHDRMRDSHDLWHTVTGYSGDLVGEGALLAFSFAQTWNPGVGLIVAVGSMRGLIILPHASWQFVRGFLRGRRAKWLPAVEWEKLLELPLERVRRELGVDAPPVYATVRSNELPVTGLL